MAKRLCTLYIFKPTLVYLHTTTQVKLTEDVGAYSDQWSLLYLFLIQGVLESTETANTLAKNKYFVFINVMCPIDLRI